MKLWLSKNSEIPLRDQLKRQVMLAIASGDLNPGDRLPSVREIAYRFKVHQNTVSNAYQLLEESGWVESRKGSGVFVRELAEEKRASAKSETESELEKMISLFFKNAHRQGYSGSQVEAGLRKFLSSPKPERILIAEEDEYLRRIIFSEINSGVNFPVFGISAGELIKNGTSKASVVVSMPETAERIRPHLSGSDELLILRVNSAQARMKGERKPEPHEMIAVVSGWDMFLRWAKTFLIAAGIDAESILIRNVNEKNYSKGLQSCVFLIADSATARILPKSLNVRPFRLVADDSIEELRGLVS